MGFFSDLKEDLSQAVNELMPEEELALAEQAAEELAGEAAEEVSEVNEEVAEEDVSSALEAMLENIDSIELPKEQEEAEIEIPEEVTSQLEEKEEEKETEDSFDLESMLDNALAAETHVAAPKVENKGVERRMDSYTNKNVSDESAIITLGMKITGDIETEGSVDVIGTINGNISALGKLNVTGHINGNSKAAEIYAEGAKINGEVISEGAVKIGSSSVIIGNISAGSAVIAGAVKGDIDVKGPVVLDASAIVMGNIKSKSVQINNGAVIEGMCSQCYAEVNPISFFDDYKPSKAK